jgi:uncharacterized small protein (DUF1192 family)
MSSDALAKKGEELQEIDFVSEFNQLIRLDIVKSLEAWYASDFERRITELTELLQNHLTRQLREQFNAELETQRKLFESELDNQKKQFDSELGNQKKQFDSELENHRKQSNSELENQIGAMRSEYEARMDSQLDKWDSDRKAMQQAIEDLKQPMSGLQEEIAKLDETIRKNDAALKQMMSDDSLPLGSIMEAKLERMELLGYLKGLNFHRREQQ